MISRIVIKRLSAIRAKKARPTIFSSVCFLSFLPRSLKSPIRNQRPPSRAGIGRTFIQAREMEITAAKKARLVGPALVKAGKSTPIIPTGPETESPTLLICFFPSSLVWLSPLNCLTTPWKIFLMSSPKPSKVLVVIWAVVPIPTKDADQV